MNQYIGMIKKANRFIFVMTCLFCYPFIPLGVVIGLLWTWIASQVMLKRQILKVNVLIVLIFLLVIPLDLTIGHKNSLRYFGYLYWYPNWWLYTKLNLHFFYFSIIIGFTLSNFFIISSPEIMFEVQRREVEGEIEPDYRKASIAIPDGVPLGTDVNASSLISIYFKELNGHLAAFGTTGSGKTVTLLNFILAAIQNNMGLIYVDGKGDQNLPLRIKKWCQMYNRPFKMFEMNADANTKYNPLTVGKFTELKDKLLTMKSVDNSDGKFYQTAEGEYLQFVFKVLQKANIETDLYTLGEYLSMPKLFDLISRLKDTELQNEARDIKERLGGILQGLISDINTFVKSELGHLFKCENGDEIIDLERDLKNGTVIYFSLNDLNYADYASRIGKLIINDLKSVFGRVSESNPLKVMGIFDEFTTYAGEQFTTLLSRSRSKGMHAIVATQSFDTIDKISKKLASDLIANCNTYIIHRQNSDIDAGKLSDVIGKVTSYDVSFHDSARIDNNMQGNNMSSSRTYRKVRENRLPTEKIQQLDNGYAYVLRKLDGSKVTLVKIRYIKDEDVKR